MRRKQLDEMRNLLIELGLPDTEEQPKNGWFFPTRLSITKFSDGQILGHAEYRTGGGWLRENNTNSGVTRNVYATWSEGKWTRVDLDRFLTTAPDELGESWHAKPWDAWWTTKGMPL